LLATRTQRLIGYCPQFDPLFPLLTGREHLEFYARLKGVEESDIKVVVDEQIKRMDLIAHCDRTSGGYSGGNKRKLSVACALIGDPKIVFLDEPSTGMDPLARRFMWSIVNQIAEEKDTSIILTTHSMEEAEALCSKIGIMVDGYFRCIGSGQHLKNKFGKGYQIEINAQEATPAAVTGGNVEVPVETTLNTPTGDVVTGIVNFFRVHFPNHIVLESQDHRLRINLPELVQVTPTGNTPLTIGGLFGVLESAKGALRIQDYSISQTTLEQIFNGFAKKQAFTSSTGTHAVGGAVVVPATI
jgi:ABC-type multidrug transport system ATPase subunit